ncbi:hypothetical protein Tco_1240319 [Tanacetum coccineum]
MLTRMTLFGTLRRVAKPEPIPKFVYSTAPACHDALEKDMGEECSERVTYTLRSLKKAKLNSKFRGSKIIQLENIRTAIMEEIQSVQSRSYILSLMQLTTEAKAKGILHFEGTELSPGGPLSNLTGKIQFVCSLLSLHQLVSRAEVPVKMPQRRNRPLTKAYEQEFEQRVMVRMEERLD